MRHQEGAGVAHPCIDVIHHHENACTLQVQVDIGVDDGVAAYVHPVVLGLERELLDGGHVGRGVVGGEIPQIRPELQRQDLEQPGQQVEIMIERQVGQGQYGLVAGLLPDDFVVQVENAQLEVLLQHGRKHLHAPAVLHGDGVGAEVRVVLDVLQPEAQVGPPAADVQLALDARAELLAHVVEVPGEVVGVIVAHVERGQQVRDVGAGIEVDRVLAQAEIQVHVTLDLELPDGLARQPHFAGDVVVQQLALAFGQLAAHEEFMFVILHGRGDGQRRIHVHQGVAAELVGDVGRQPRLGVFVESLQQGDAEHILHAQRQGGVVALPFLEVGIVIQCLLSRGFGARPEAVARAFHPERMDEAGDGHELVLDDGVHGDGRAVPLRFPAGGGVLRLLHAGHLAVEAQAVAVRQVEVEVVVAVGGLLQAGGDVLASAHVVHLLGAGDVAVVRDASVLVHLQEVVVVGGVHLVLVADVAGEDARVEVRRRLVGVVSAPVEVVDVEAHGQAFVDVDREVGLEAVLAVHFVAGLVVRQVGIGHVAVREEQLVGAHVEAGEGGDEDGGLVVRPPLQEDARQAGRAQVAQVVIVSFHALAQVGVLEVQAGRIRRDEGPLAQGLVHPPHIEFGGQALYVDRAVLQVVRLEGRVYLVAILVAHRAALPRHRHLGARQGRTQKRHCHQ